MKGTLAAIQRYKVKERPKAISHAVFILPRRKASIQHSRTRRLSDQL
jgi:hypothetical protein